MSTDLNKKYDQFVFGDIAPEDNTAQKKASAEQKISVIQCPNCQTKFALESSKLTSITNPRFHCSRCDQVFTLQEPFLPAFTEEEQKPSSNFPCDFDSFIDDTQDEQELEDAIGDQLFNYDIGENFSKQPDEQLGYDVLSRNLHGLNFNYSINEPQVSKSDDQILINQVFDPTLVKKNQSLEGNFKILLLPGLVAVLMFAVIAFVSIVSPKSVLNFSGNLLATKSLKLPPELYIKNAQVKRVVLDSGESVSVISGTIKNGSTLQITELYVEGAIFDPHNNMLNRRQANVDSALKKARVQSLSPTIIDQMQMTKSAKKLNLNPNQTTDFTVVVPEPEVISALPPTSFVVRLYSGRVKI